MGAQSAAAAWAYLRRSAEYRTAFGHEAGASILESAPLRVRVQGEADLAAARFALLAFEDPERDDGAVSPFWCEAPTLGGELVSSSRALLPLLAAAGARIEGLRLVSGALVLKIERGEAAAQVRIERPGPFPAEAGLVVRLDYGLALPHAVERVKDLWGLAHGPAPRRGLVRGEDIASC